MMKSIAYKEYMMARRKKVISSLDMFRKEPEVVTLDGTTIKAGDMIKINGEHGKRFQFKNFVTNINTEATWIDCYEMEKGLPCGLRSFRLDRVRTIPVRVPRKKRKTKTH